MANSEPSNQAGPTDADPRPAAVAIVSTEHFTLQGARSSTIAESTGQASMFLGAVTGGLVALGFRTYARSLSSEPETRPPRRLIAGNAVEKPAGRPIASASSIMHGGGPAVGRPIGRTVVAGGGARDV